MKEDKLRFCSMTASENRFFVSADAVPAVSEKERHCLFGGSDVHSVYGCIAEMRSMTAAAGQLWALSAFVNSAHAGRSPRLLDEARTKIHKWHSAMKSRDEFQQKISRILQ